MALWTPAQLGSKVTNWYDASVTSSLTVDGSNKVVEWRDISGNGRHLNTDIQTLDRPAYSATAFNSLPGVNYSSFKWQETNQNQGVSGEYNVTFFMAHQWGNTGAGFGRMWTHGASASADALGYLRGGSSTAVYLSLEGGTETSYYSSVTTTAKISSGGKLSTTPSTYKLWHDGTLLTKTSEGSDGTQNTTNTTLKINCNGGYDQRNDQIIGEMVFCFGNALTDAERQLVEGYMAWRWGLQGNLPAGHPYKSAAPTTVTNEMAAVETGSDTFASVGDVIVAGSLTVTETGADTFASTGTVVSVSSGTLAATETGADTFASSGTVSILGALAVSETGADTFAATGAIVPVLVGTLAATESGSDTFASAGTVGNGFNITAVQALLLLKLCQLHGLTTPLVVGPTSRTSGDLVQSVTQAGDIVTVTTTDYVSNFSGDPGLYIEELAALHGITTPLVVTSTSRTAGTIVQTISSTGGVTTVTRQ